MEPAAFQQWAGLLPEALLLLGANGVIADLNPPAARLLNSTAAELRGRDLSDLVVEPADVLSGWMRMWARTRELTPGVLTIRAQGAPVQIVGEGGLLQPPQDGSGALILLRCTPKGRAASGFKALNEKIADLGREVESRRRAQALLASQNKLLELTARSAPLTSVLTKIVEVIEERAAPRVLASVLLLDRDGKRLRHGAAPSLPAEYCRAIDGVSIGPSVGSCGTAAFSGAQVIAVDIADDPRWEGYREIALAHELRSCWSTPIFSSSGKVIGTFALYSREPRAPGPQDLELIELSTRTAAIAIERARAEEDRDLQDRELARSNAELERFAYVASHDLQEPLRTIASFVQLLRRRYRGKLDADADAYIDFAAAGAARMSELIEDLLEFSRVGRRPGPLRTVNAREIAEHAVRSVAMALAQCGGEAIVEDLPEVKADPAQLTRVFQNLVSNAVAFRSAERLKVSIGCAVEGGEYVFSVRDNGIGIDPQYHDLIFVMFKRLHGSELPGTGIGLAICKKVVEAHGGRIWVESKPGEGADFKFTLPR